MIVARSGEFKNENASFSAMYRAIAFRF